MSSSVYTFLSLVLRDLTVLKRRILDLFWDNFFLLLTNVAMFGYLLPLMGMSNDLVAPLFIGYVVMSILELGFGLGIKIVNDIEFDRFIDYQITLPISLSWLLASYVISFAIKACVVTLPVLCGGILLLGNRFVIIQAHWFSFSVMYIIALLFFATLFMYYSVAYDYHWFTTSIWSRRLEPLFLFGSLFTIWKPLYAFSKPLGILFLCNPFTYVAEGMRSALIGGDGFLPTWICLLVISACTIGIWFMLNSAMRKKLDLINPNRICNE